MPTTARYSAEPLFAMPSPRYVRDSLVGPRLVEADAALRPSLEQFIASRYQQIHGARLRHFLPRLFGAVDGGGTLVAAYGVRVADSGPLFLEQYLDAPIEACALARFGRRAARARIVEIGNLAGATPGALRALIPAVTAWLLAEGHEFIAFTGAAPLRNAFGRLGLPLCELATARVDCLPEDERADWGQYYALNPAVMLGDIGAGRRLLTAEATSPRDLRARLAPLAMVGAP